MGLYDAKPQGGSELSYCVFDSADQVYIHNVLIVTITYTVEIANSAFLTVAINQAV